MTQYATRTPDDDTATNILRSREAAAVTAGGSLSASLTDGCGEAWLLLELPEGSDPNVVLALPAPLTWLPRDQVS